MLRCTDDLLETVATVSVSWFASRVAVRIVVFPCLLPLFLDPSGEATKPRFEFHMPVTSVEFKNVRGGVMFAIVPVFFVTLLSEPTTGLTINLSESMTDGTMMPELPEGLPQSSVSVNFLFIKA